ncbi:hypothetical protein [Cryobacterium sp. W22_MBD10_FK3]|uniref:hypothetical protein n=1 Tax=Cryobacterium sp. W22_MBD10_FK3 TaxID=3240273 RepID=UPI003F92BD79
MKDLVPDPENVRIKGVQPDERATIAYLYASEGVLELAREISQDGYFDNDLPIATLVEGRLIVLEGNRRVSALKGLLVPANVPTYEKQLQGLASRIDNFEEFVPSIIRVMIAPNRTSAQPILARLHTRDAKKAWGLEQQATFYYSQLNSSTTVDDLRALYPSVANKIARFITISEMARLFRAAAAISPAAVAFTGSVAFKMTSLEYLYKSAHFQRAAGLTINSDGFVTEDGREAFRRRMLVQVLADLQAKYISTRGPRILQRSPEHSDYIQSLVDIANGVKATHLANIEGDNNAARPVDLHSSGAGPLTTSATKEGAVGPRVDSRERNPRGEAEPRPDYAESRVNRAPNRSVHDSRLNWIGLEYSLESAPLRLRFDELRLIDVHDFPNATMDMIRTFLECTLKQYFRESSNDLPNSHQAQLSHCLTHAGDHFADDSRLSAILAGLKAKKSLQRESYLRSAQSLNASNHEPDVTFSRKDVNETWAAVHPLIGVLLAGPTALERQPG